MTDSKLLFEPTISISKVPPSWCKKFSCGVGALDEYLHRYARGNDKHGIGKTFVLCEKNEVLGYYTLSAAQISILDIPQSHKNRLPYYPIPATRLCRLAVHQAIQGKGIGEHLLGDALERILNVARQIAVHSVVVDAKNDKAKRFYIKCGFIPLEGNDLSLFLPINTLDQA